jgi:hypothetical protein
MTSETKFRLALSLLLLALGLLVAKNVFGGPPPLISIDVIPKVATANPYKSMTFRVRFRIEPNENNREFAYFATCGVESKTSIRKVDATTFTFFEELTVVETCQFQVCLSRLGEKTPHCVKQEVLVPGG